MYVQARARVCMVKCSVVLITSIHYKCNRSNPMRINIGVHLFFNMIVIKAIVLVGTALARLLHIN